MAINLVIGVDLSFSRTAVVRLHRGEEPQFRLITTELDDRADEVAKSDRIDTIVEQVCLYSLGADLVVLEHGSYGSIGRSRFDLAGLWWVTYRHLRSMGLPVAVVSPSTLKKWASGDGRASKIKVALAIAKRWHHLDLGGDDEADALVLASMGAQHAGWLPWRPIAVQVEQARKVAWPAPGAVAA